MQQTDSVTIAESANGHARVRTGAFDVEVNTTDGYVSIRRWRNDATPTTDELTLSPGGPYLELLASSTVTDVSTESEDQTVRVSVTGQVDAGEYVFSLDFPHDHPGTISYQLEAGLSAAETLVTERWEPALTANDRADDSAETEFTTYLDGTPGSNPAAGTDDLNQFAYVAADVIDATLLYLADWPALDEYFQRTGTNMRGTVSKTGQRIGYVPPTPDGEHSGFDTDEEDTLTLLAGTVKLTPDVVSAEEPRTYSTRFVTDLSAIYDRMNRPRPSRIDWHDVSNDTLDAVCEPANRYEYDGEFHPGGVELVTVLSIVTPFRAYAEQFDDEEAAALTENVASLVETYYDPTYEDADGNTGMIGNSPAPLSLSHVDAWYLFWPVIQAAEFALAFEDDDIAAMVVDTADVMVDVGQALDYEFPMWLDVDSLSGHEPEDRQWDGYQYDCTGAYAYLMCQYYDLTGDDRYLEEASAAADQLLQYGFELPYEFTTTPLTPIAMVRVAHLTGDDRYIEASYIGLANVLRHAYFFDPNYGSFTDRSVFLLNEAMPPDGYEGNFFANALEEWSLLYYLDRYLREGGDALSVEARRLTTELLRHKGSSLADSLARFQPDESLVFDGISPQSGRRVNHNWALPLEPFGALEPMFDQLGEVGQDLYGAGVYPELATQQTHPLDDGLKLFVDGPVDVKQVDSHTWRVETIGAETTYDAALVGETETMVDCSVREGADGDELGPEIDAQFEAGGEDDTPEYRFSLEAETTYFLRRTVPKRAIIVEEFDVAETHIQPGANTTVSMVVVNTAAIAGTYEVPLSVGTETKTKSITLEPYDRHEVTFTIAPTDPGTYNVQIAHENRALHVED